jgi:O-antigen/teichoic acid export membrane protein
MPCETKIENLVQLNESPVAGMAASTPQTSLRAAPQVNGLATRSGLYLTARYGLSILVSIGNMFLLTRWIGPHAYGLFVTAVGLTTVLGSLTRFGVDTYLVRCEPPPQRAQYNVAFTLILINSFALAALGLLCVPLLKIWYAGDEFTAPYLVLLITVPLTGVAGLPMAKLERDLDFHAVAGIELGGQVLAFAVAAILAWRGFGVWAPVTGLFCWQVFALAAACIAARFSPGIALRRQEARRMLTFGLGFASSMRMWQLRSLVNPLLVGRFAGAEGVALVALALRVAEGIGFLRTAAGRLAIAALGRLRDDRDSLRRALERALQLQVVILGPLLCLFALCGPWLVPRVMGARWTGVLGIYPFVAIGVLLSSVFNLQASALFVIGEQWAVLKAFSCHVGLLALTTFLLLPRLGIVAYGWAELIACAGYYFIHSALSTAAPISYRKVARWLALFISMLAITGGRSLTLGTLAVTLVIGLATIAGWLSTRLHPWDIRSVQTERVHVLCRQVRTFLVKASIRGCSYIAAVARFEVMRVMYHVGGALNRAKTSPTGRAKQYGSSTREFTRNDVCMAEAVPVGRFHFAAADIPLIVEHVPNVLKRRTVEEANRILAHRFMFRNREEQFACGVNWDSCPDGNLSWRWDLNRHRFFLTLAAAHYYTGEHQYIQHMLELWNHWIQTNPAGENGNWTHPFEVAARLQNWVWAYFFLAYSSQSRPRELVQLENALLEHARHVANHLEYHWPNNHLLLEAKALYAFALSFPHLDKGKTFLRRAQRVLTTEVFKQILPDGSHAELSSMYHRIVCGELEELLLLAERAGAPLPDRIAERIRRMHFFSGAMVRPDNSVPLLGDSAEKDTYLRFDSMNIDYSDLNYWLWPGPSRRRLSKCLPKVSARPGIQLFPDAGYAFLRSPDEQAHVSFDCGQFSRCETQNHGHSDALSFELWINGHAVLVDPGVYFPWNDDNGWAAHFRSTAAHNTVEIDGKSQSEISPWCDVRRTAKCQILRQAVDADCATISAQCVPYWSNGDDVRHTREISLSQGHLKIRDRIDGIGVHSLAWSFQFLPELDVVHRHGSLEGSVSGRELFSLASPRPEQLLLELFYGHKNPLRGWASRDTSHAVPAPLARFSTRTLLPFETEFEVTFYSHPQIS